MTPIDKSYAELEQEALRLWTDVKDRAGMELICTQFDRVKMRVGDLQKSEYEGRVKAAGMGGCCD